jgi:hemolysin D
MNTAGDLPAASPTLRLTAWVLATLFFAIVVGSAVGKTEIVARGSGKVISSGRTQVVQPQFAGQVRQVHAKEGDFVAKGDVLVTLDEAALKSEIAQINSDIERNTSEFQRARAILTPLESLNPSDRDFIRTGLATITIEPDAQGGLGKLVAALAAAELHALKASIAEIDKEIASAISAIATQNARIDAAEKNLNLISQRNESAGALQEKGTISRAQYIERMRETRNAESELAISLSALTELNQRREVLRLKRERTIADAKAAYRRKLSEAELALQALEANLAAAETRLRNARLRAPVSGFVEDLKVHTIGSHVDAGQALLSIVPEESGLEIEAFFENRDAGFLKANQKAFIKLDAFPAERFGILSGVVTLVGADARKVEGSAGWVFSARVRPEKFSIEDGNTPHRLLPGMTGMIDVVTGERRLISYFFEPIVKAVQDGMGER